MTNSKQTKSALFSSVVALLLCFTMLLGTTFAWFTDNASSSVNKIQAGTLDIQLLDASGNSLEGKTLSWQKATGHENNEVLWEPGCTYNLQNITIKNNVFYNTANHPGGTTVGISQTTNWANYISGKNISLTDNVFVNCGKLFTVSNVKDLTFSDNLIVNPMIYDKAVTQFKDIATMSKATCSTKAYKNNVVYLTSGTAVAGDNPLKLTTAAKVSQAVDICHDDSLSVSAMLKKLRELFL